MRRDSDVSSDATAEDRDHPQDLERNGASVPPLSHPEKMSEDELALEPKHIDTSAYLVTWNGPDDPENPQNWPFRKKVFLTALLSIICLVCTFGSSIFSAAQHAAGQHFDVPDEVMNLGTSLFLIGYAVSRSAVLLSCRR